MYINKCLLLCALIISSWSVKARELDFKERGFTYTLSVEESFIRFKTVNTDVSIEKQKCSAHIVDRFRKEFDRYMKGPLAQVERTGSVIVKLDSNSGYVHKKDERATYLRSMPNQIKQLKIEERLNCNTK